MKPSEFKKLLEANEIGSISFEAHLDNENGKSWLIYAWDKPNNSTCLSFGYQIMNERSNAQKDYKSIERALEAIRKMEWKGDITIKDYSYRK